MKIVIRCQEANETNNKKIQLNKNILKDNLEKRRLKLKVKQVNFYIEFKNFKIQGNINLSKELFSKFKYSQTLGNLENNLSRKNFESINDVSK